MSEYPEKNANKVWVKDGAMLSVILQDDGHYCGYVRFAKRPVVERGYDGFVTYIPVHGGITFARGSENGSMVYGFDCAHAGDWVSYCPSGHKWTEDEVVVETEKLLRNFQLGLKYEKRYLGKYSRKGRYLRKNTVRERAKILDEYMREADGTGIMDNFGVLINLFTGQL